MDQPTKERMKRLSEWMRDLYREYAKAMLDKTGIAPTDWQFARDVLGTSDYNYSRWRDLKNPIGDLNLLLLAINTGDLAPLEIFEKTDLLGDPVITTLITSWRRMPAGDRARILEIVEGAENRPRSFLAQGLA
jgi:hypothetical protein